MLAAVATLLFLPAAAAASSQTWTRLFGPTSGVLSGVTGVGVGSGGDGAIIAGGFNGLGNGLFKIDGEGKNLTQVMDIEASPCKICMMEAVRMARDGKRGVAVGVSMLGQPVSYSTTDGGSNWTPSPVLAKGFSGAISGHDIEIVGNQLEMGKGEDGQDGNLNRITWAFVSEFNSNLPRDTVCTHGTVSPQCSGYALSSDMGTNWTTVDWDGTDGPDTDAMYGAFPSASVHYIAGGLVQAESEPGAYWKAYITKTEDGGKTFKTVFNVTATQKNPGGGVGGMSDIECFDTEHCVAVSSCYDDDCAERYGSFVHMTKDGGKTWSTSDLFYESVFNVISLTEGGGIYIGGGGVGAFDKARIWHSADGRSWTNQSLAMGTVLSIDVTPDGSDGWAVAVSPAASTSSIYRFQ